LYSSSLPQRLFRSTYFSVMNCFANKRTKIPVAACLLWSACVADAQTEPEFAKFLPENGPAEQDYAELHNLLQISTSLYSGGEPKSEAAFAQLKSLGVKTIVSVDGARPNLLLAEKYGLRYVHIPIGYDGVGEDEGKLFTKVARSIKGPVYVHCHHGKHRGPAAAAIICIAAGDATTAEARRILEVSGTSKDYAGLCRDVASFVPPAEDMELPELTAVATVDSLAVAMANVDRAHDHLKLLAANDWNNVATHPDLSAVQEALLLRESFRETVRMLEKENDYDAKFLTLMQETETTCKEMEDALKAADIKAALEKFKQVQDQCTRCHTTYRN
jgi:protein tyrosine phosphatase (PTP) superfamily phosphohydrolase (DUF442 family)